MRSENHTARVTTRSRRERQLSPAVEDNLFLLLTPSQWQQAIIVGVTAALVCLPLYWTVSLWVGVAVCLMAITIIHMRHASRFIIPFPHIVLAIALLQYVLAAWAAGTYQAIDPLYNIGVYLPNYLSYATPVVVACALGWGLGLANLHPPARLKLRPAPDLLRTLDWFIVIGFIGLGMSRLSHNPLFDFVFFLLSYLRFVGVLGRMLCKGPGWGWRLALVLLIELVLATSNAMFHGLILWLLWTATLWIFVYTPPLWKVVTGIMAALLLLLPLNDSKWQLRRSLYGRGKSSHSQSNVSELEKTGRWLTMLGESIVRTVSGKLDDEFIGESVSRFNQGWIVNRVMQVVPSQTPYAKGETLKDALISVMVPRFLDPGKVKSGGKTNMLQYAGVQLEEGTSMNLGYAGEMYANFGYWGGIIGCGIYSLALALLFRAICLRAFVAPLWWAIMPYICFESLKAEDDVVGVWNWISKACVVMAVIIYIFPAFRRALFPKQKRASDTSSLRMRRGKRRRLAQRQAEMVGRDRPRSADVTPSA